MSSSTVLGADGPGSARPVLQMEELPRQVEFSGDTVKKTPDQVCVLLGHDRRLWPDHPLGSPGSDDHRLLCSSQG